MHRARLLVAWLILFLASMARGESPKVAIIPFTPTEATLELKEKGEFFSSFLGAKLGDFPNVEWVEREAINNLLNEAQYASAQGSPIALGCLSKADLLLHGRVGPVTREDGDNASRTITLEVVDLTNAEILASETKTWPLDAAAKAPNADSSILQPLAERGRALLTTALEKRRSQATARVIAPVFLANLGAGVRLDVWAKQMLNDLEAATVSTPHLRLLKFQGATQASGEQHLALLGLTNTDPTAWQKAADGYLWGGYREIAVSETTAFEDIQVEAELFLWMGDRPPERFSRTFTVRDFARESQALTREVIAAAANAPASKATDATAAGREIAQKIFSALAETMGPDFFLHPSHASIKPNERPTPWCHQIQKLPYGKEKLAHCIKTLQLASFFDPENPQWHVIRLLLNEPWSQDGQIPNQRMADAAMLARQFERFTQKPDFDNKIFAAAADRIIYQLIENHIQGWRRRFPENSPEATTRRPWDFSLDAPLSAERSRLLTETGLYLPSGIKKYLEQSNTPPQRSLALHWLIAALKSDLPAPARLGFMESIWPYIAPEQRAFEMEHSSTISTELDRLMEDLKDRPRVQAALQLAPLPIKQELSGRHAPGTGRPSLDPSSMARRPVSMSSPRPLSSNLASTLASLYAGLSKTAAVPAPYLRDLDFDLLKPAYSGNSSDQPILITPHLEGYGDHLIIDFEDRSDDGRCRTIVPLRYSSSSNTLTPMKEARPGTVSCRGGKVVYRQADKVGWQDLATGASGVFEFEAGLSVANPSLVSVMGTDTIYVGGEVRDVSTIGTFDWKSGRWLTPPPPPEEFTKAKQAKWWRRGATPSTKDWLLFPSWALLYRPATQEWKQVDQNLAKAAYYTPSQGMMPLPDKKYDAIALDNDFWMWNPENLKQYSPDENRIIWQTMEDNLSGIASDGPYLWLFFNQTEPAMGRRRPEDKNSGPRSKLVLMDRKTHAPLGALEAPHLIQAAHFGNHDTFFIARQPAPTRGMGGIDGARLLTVERKALYAALKIAPPTTAITSSATAPAEAAPTAASLYHAILAEDAERVGQLLAAKVSPDSTFGPEQTPALMVAASTRNLPIAQMLITHGAKVDATASVPVNMDHVQLPSTAPGSKRLELFVTRTALSTAASQSDPAMAELLLKASANPDGTGTITSPLAEAVRSRSADTVAMLLAHGATLAATDPARGMQVPDIARVVKEEDAKAIRSWEKSPMQVDPSVFTKASAVFLKKLTPIIGAPDITDLVVQENAPEIARKIIEAKSPLSPVARERLTALAYGSAEGSAVGTTEPSAGSAASWTFEELHELITDALKQGDEPRIIKLIKAHPRDRMTDKAIPKILEDLVKSGRAEAVKAMLAQGANWKVMTESPIAPNLLWAALKKKDLPMTLALLDAGVEPRFCDGRFISTLEYAASHINSPELLERLLKAYPDFQTLKVGYGNLGGCALNGAIMASQFDNALFLLKQGVSPDALDCFGNPPFHAAFSDLYREPRKASILAGAGANLLAKDLAGRSAFDYPSQLDRSGLRRIGLVSRYQPASEMEQRGLQILTKIINERPNDQELLAAVQAKDAQAMRALIARNPARWTLSFPKPTQGLVYAAVLAGSEEIVKLLLSNGWSPNIGENGVDHFSDSSRMGGAIELPSPLPTPNSNCRTPIGVAAEKGDTALVTLLLEYHAFVPAKDQSGRNAIDLAATPEIAELLGREGRSQSELLKLQDALNISRWKAPEEFDIVGITQILKRTPEVISARGLTGLTPLAELSDNWFSSRKLGEMRQAFSTLKIPLDAHDQNGMSALHRIILLRESYEVGKLVEMGFNPRFTDTRGMTAIDLANTILNERERLRTLKTLR